MLRRVSKQFRELQLQQTSSSLSQSNHPAHGLVPSVRELCRSHPTRGLHTQDPAASGFVCDKILIANRGEIACRIIKTARKLGIRTVAVYSEPDKACLHVQMADEAVCIGSAPPTSSYLNHRSILNAMRITGAHAVHPGYGFLSENAQFAELCKEQGLTFIGPPVNAIRAMGDKSESKKLMSAAGVPVVPGYHGENQDAEFLKSQADKIGYPIIIKATQGGGGKGMKIVSHSEEFFENLHSAQREAQASFGDERVLIEKYILQPRHVEVQVFGDKHGNVVHLFERDCSVQRRHQKIIEEAPAPKISDGFRRQIGEAAVNAAKAVGYYNAGTVEFIMDSISNEFFFMEMNTRLQVEHPITEMVTNQDLVEWQIRVASGEPLPCRQNELKIYGHAFEARIYAENIESGFLPASGILHYYHPPDISSNVRVETGVRQGDSVTIHYDPMIAKLVVWGHNRSSALRKLQDSLSKFQISGLPTNISFLKALSQHQAFMAGDVGTHFIEHHKESLLGPTQRAGWKVASVIAAACICEKDLMEARTVSLEGRNGWQGSHPMFGFRLNHQLKRSFMFDAGQLHLLVMYSKDHVYVIKMQDGEEMTVKFVRLTNDLNDIKLEVNGVLQCITASFYTKDNADWVDIWYNRTHHEFSFPKHNFTPSDQNLDVARSLQHQTGIFSGPAGGIFAPMAGRLTKILVADGAIVQKGDPLVIMEAMKMEHVVRAPKDGYIEGLTLKAGDHVRDNSLLLILKDQNI